MGTGILDKMLHILYCEIILKNTKGKAHLTCNEGLVQYFQI